MNWTKTASIVLVVSVALNLLIVGFLAGQNLPDKYFPGPLAERPRAAGPAPARAVPPGVGGWARNELDILAGAQVLKESDRQTVRRILTLRTPEVRASMQELQAKRRALMAQLENPENVTALETAFADVAQASAAAQKRGQDVFLEITRELTGDARVAFLRAAGSSAAAAAAANAERRPRPRNQQPRPGL